MSKEIIVQEYHDLNDDGIKEVIYLMGNRPTGGDSAFVDGIELIIQDGRSGLQQRIAFPVDAGYSPHLVIGDFTNTGVQDLMVGFSSGGSGDYGVYYVYMNQGNDYVNIFDSEQFNQTFRYSVQYLDGYKVLIKELDSAGGFIIDLSQEDQKNLENIYDHSGKLKKQYQGSVSPLNFIYTVDEYNGRYQLIAIQRIIGQYNADTLGYIETPLVWNGSTFIGNPRLGPRELFPSTERVDLSGVDFLLSEKQRDRSLEKALIEEFQITSPFDQARYYYNRIDLNDDGIPEVFAYLVGPQFCGSGGCSAAIFTPTLSGGYRLISRFTLVNTPIFISEKRTNGYRDLVMNVEGGGTDSFYARLTYSQQGYPSNPSLQPPVKMGSKIKGTAILADEINWKNGLPFS